MPKPGERVFCDNCQNESEIVFAMGPQGKRVPRCSMCGSIIKEEPEEKTISLDEVSFTDDSISIPNLDTIMVVGYSPGIRQLLVDKMTEKQLARRVVSKENGEEMIVHVIGEVENRGGNGRLDLVVTDVPMPFLNGINAMIGLRAIERTYQEHDTIPILFLTNKPCDDTFKKVIRYLNPAKYATLGPVDNKEALIKHLSKVLGLISHERW